MTHPFKTSLCPTCGHSFPKTSNLLVSWNCLGCKWVDSLFGC